MLIGDNVFGGWVIDDDILLIEFDFNVRSSHIMHYAYWRGDL